MGSPRHCCDAEVSTYGYEQLQKMNECSTHNSVAEFSGDLYLVEGGTGKVLTSVVSGT